MDDVVPARPEFGTRFRGFDRKQVAGHLDALETRIRELQDALERATDETWRDPEAVEFAEQRAEAILDHAQEQAADLITEAERVAAETRADCAELAGELETRRARLEHEQSSSRAAQHHREHRLRRRISQEYKRITSVAQQHAEAMLERTKQRCEQRDAQTEELRCRVLAEIDRRHAELEQREQETRTALHTLAERISSCSAALDAAGLATDGRIPHPAGSPAPQSEVDGVGVKVVVDDRSAGA
ncbi:hypothetical protein [Saccharopolyspora rosea]|uniref:DivIVA domain-containing protein n=1 Tax=Saccharopolyspora rosea TaxID=524884 RepID=A0ABW3FUF2_9PSEU|nr:hypothetical protein [Saccharopolyspora rosea]